MDIAILAVYGIVAGILAGIFGIGGGTIIVPAMTLLGFGIKEAIGISIMQMVFSSIYGTFLNLRAKVLNLRIAIFVALGGLCGAALSGVIVDSLKPLYLEVAFLLVCFYMLYKNVKSPQIPQSAGVSKNIKIILFITGFITGIFAISLGIGGGLIIVPVVSYYLGLPTKKVVPISLFFVIFSSFSGFLSLAYHGYVNYKEGVVVGIFSLLGVYIGTKINQKISNKSHKNAVVVMYLIILIVMLRNIWVSLKVGV